MTKAGAPSVALWRAERWIALVLRYGVILCAAVMAAGMALLLWRPSPALEGDLLARLKAGDPNVLGTAPRTWAAFVDGLAALDANVVISLGVVMLIALPIIRVGLTVIIFALERDWIYLAITIFVLSVLMLGVVYGFSG